MFFVFVPNNSIKEFLSDCVIGATIGKHCIRKRISQHTNTVFRLEADWQYPMNLHFPWQWTGGGERRRFGECKNTPKCLYFGMIGHSELRDVPLSLTDCPVLLLEVQMWTCLRHCFVAIILSFVYTSQLPNDCATWLQFSQSPLLVFQEVCELSASGDLLKMWNPWWDFSLCFSNLFTPACGVLESHSSLGWA